VDSGLLPELRPEQCGKLQSKKAPTASGLDQGTEGMIIGVETRRAAPALSKKRPRPVMARADFLASK